MFINNATDVGREFGVDLIGSKSMNAAIQLWDNISTGKPPWLDADDNIDTINMAKHVSDTRAKLAMLDIGIAISGSPRADYLQTLADQLIDQLPDKIADADRLGGMIIKWNGESWDFIYPGNFGITEVDHNGKITGAIFAAFATQGDAHFTRLEYHRFEGSGENRVYRVTNRAYRNQITNGSASGALGRRVPLDSVAVWSHIQEEVWITKLKHPLFAYYRVPGANHVDQESPLGTAVFANALHELKALDIAISRKDLEVEDSKHITFVGQSVVQNATKKGIKLPRFVRGLGMGLNDAETTAVHEHAPILQTDPRIKDINFNLSMVGVKCGFSEGVFVLNGQTGVITATQVEANDRDTIQTIKTDRDALKATLEQAFYAADALTSLYKLAPLGSYEINFNFGDITYNYEEDKATWRFYATQGWVPKWMYLVKFEGMSEEEARALVAEAAQASAAPGLFDEE